MLCCARLCCQDGSSLVLACPQTSSGDTMYCSKKDQREEIFLDDTAAMEARLRPTKLRENRFAHDNSNVHANEKLKQELLLPQQEPWRNKQARGEIASATVMEVHPSMLCIATSEEQGRFFSDDIP